MKQLALLAALVACKADLHHTVDGGPPDVTPDTLGTTTGEAPANAVKLTITRGGMPVPNVAVFFQGADSSLVTAALTNDTGLAWGLAPAGGFVTAREHRAQDLEELTTFAAVQPGDALVLEIDPTGVISDVTLPLTVPSTAGATSYQIHTPCGLDAMAGASGTITLAGCGSATDMVIVPTDVDGVALGAIYTPSVALDGGGVTITGTYQPLATMTLAFTNVPASVSSLGVYEAVSAERRAFEDTSSVVPTSGSATATLQTPSTSATHLTATAQVPISGEVGQQLIYHWHAGTASYSLDLASVQLPPFAAAPVLDPATRTLSWTERTGTVQPDLVRARVHVYRDDIPVGRAWTWRIAGPRSGTSIVYPKLPIVDFDFNPVAGDTIGVDDLTTISLPGGYAGFHTTAFADVHRAISGTLGRIVVETLYFPSL